MANGGNAFPIPHPVMHLKHQYCKWIDTIPVIDQSGTYTLNPVTASTNNVYRINSPYSDNEYFLLEYRRHIDERFGAGVKDFYPENNGLLIQRIISNTKGNFPPFEVYIYRPEGTTTNHGNIAQAAYSDEYQRTAINDDYTNPTSFLWDGGKGGLDIYNIHRVDSTIVFDVKIVSSIEENNLISSILIIPNPVNSKAIIEVNSLETQTNTVITILDLSGREILTVYSGLLNEGVNNFPLPNNLTNGGYFVLVKNRNGQKIEQFIIAR